MDFVIVPLSTLGDRNKIAPLLSMDRGMFVKDIETALLQEDIPLISRPFTPMAARLRITLQELFNTAQAFQERNIMRRFSAVLHHRRAGFSSNAMAVWKVPSERSIEVGNTMAQSKWVTHCYERPTFPDWKYTHFTMIHATSQEQCEEVARDISEATGIADYQLLYSTREYKKTRVRYFV